MQQFVTSAEASEEADLSGESRLFMVINLCSSSSGVGLYSDLLVPCKSKGMGLRFRLPVTKSVDPLLVYCCPLVHTLRLFIFVENICRIACKSHHESSPSRSFSNRFAVLCRQAGSCAVVRSKNFLIPAKNPAIDRR